MQRGRPKTLRPAGKDRDMYDAQRTSTPKGLDTLHTLETIVCHFHRRPSLGLFLNPLSLLRELYPSPTSGRLFQTAYGTMCFPFLSSSRTDVRIPMKIKFLHPWEIQSCLHCPRTLYYHPEVHQCHCCHVNYLRLDSCLLQGHKEIYRPASLVWPFQPRIFSTPSTYSVQPSQFQTKSLSGQANIHVRAGSTAAPPFTKRHRSMRGVKGFLSVSL